MLLGSEVDGVEIAVSNDSFRLVPVGSGVRWRGRGIDCAANSFIALLNEITGAAMFDERDEFNVLYRTREFLAQRHAGSAFEHGLHAHWLVELRRIDSEDRVYFTADEWNLMLETRCHFVMNKRPNRAVL